MAVTSYTHKTMNSTWSVYIVRCSDGTLYTGTSNNVERRVSQHNAKRGAKYTKTRLPVILIYQREFEDRSIACKEEYRIKQLSRTDKLKLINE